VTTKGDNRKQRIEEAKRLIATKVPERMRSMPLEVAWASGARLPASWVPPPPWVRNVIKRALQNPRLGELLAMPNSPAMVFGSAAGIVEASELAMDSSANSATPNNGLEALFTQRMAAEMRPHWEGVRALLEAVPKKEYQKNVEDLTAYHKGQHQSSEFVQRAAAGEEQDTNTDEVLFWLWILWPQVNTASSALEVYRWMIESMELLSCGQKNFEKICTDVGFRRSRRGRKKRIPTQAR